MSYSEWLDTLVSPISNFINWLSMVANSLIHNYFVITLLGICLFLSLFWLIFYFIHDFVESKIRKYDDFNDMYDRYVLSKKVKMKYLDLHRLDEFEYLTKYLVLKRQVLIHLYNSYPDLMLESKIKNLEFTAQGIRDLKGRQISDDNPLNDNDADIFVSNPNIQLADSTELKLKKNNPMSFDELHMLHLNLRDSNNKKITNILKSNSELLKKYNLGYDEISNVFYDLSTGEVIKDIFSLDSDNLRHINGKTINIHTGSVISNEIDPIPVGNNELSKMTPEQLDEIKKYNDEHFIFPTTNKNHKYGYFDEDLDSQLFN